MEVYSLVHFLRQCPEEFLQKKELKPDSKLLTEVLVWDLFRKVYGNFNIADKDLPSVPYMETMEMNHLMSINAACWFFSNELFKQKPHLLEHISMFLFSDLSELSAFVKYRQWVEDEDRAEEFVRLVLQRCNILPEDETEEEASERLEALDTIKRNEVLKESNQAIERIKEIRRKMAEEKAREAANVYGRE